MVYMHINDKQYRRLWLSPVVPRVRAILSWNTIPTPNPFQPVVYGNVREVNIQLEPKPWFIYDLLDVHKIKPESLLIKHLDLAQPIASQQKKPIAFDELQRQYEAAKVPAHRSLYDIVYPTIKAIAPTKTPPTDFNLEFFKDKQFKWEALGELLLKSKSNTEYEQLTCVGLNSDRDLLGAVIHVKKQNGYSGSLCYQGSAEYVAFWADWDNDGNFDEYLGTAKVEVHDIPNAPDDGIFYCVSLPINVAERLRNCLNPNVVGIRGVLSWNALPSTTDPNDLNYWGNRLDVKVQIRKRETIGHGVNFHYHDIGGVPVNQINAGYGYYNPVASPYHNRPWGGNVRIAGRFGNAGPAGTVHYRVEFCNFNSANPADWQPVTTQQSFALYNPISGYYDNVVTQNSPDGWFSYLEDFSSGNVIDEYDAMLGTWNTTGKQGTHFVRVLYTTDHTHATYVTTAPYELKINNIRYNVNSAFHNYISGGATLSAAHSVDMIFDGGGGCISTQVGQTFTGSFKATHQYFGMIQLYVLPSNSQAILSSGPITTAPGGTLVRQTNSIFFSGYNNEAWSLNTAQMQKCGYVLVLDAYERTIYNNDGNLPHDALSIGFAIV
jgi:hypothetical protein